MRGIGHRFSERLGIKSDDMMACQTCCFLDLSK